MTQAKVPRLHQPYYRNGANHRSGADVSFSDIVKLFGFRTAAIGKWVNQTEQQLAANLMFDALCDLMDILQVPEKVISLSGQLSIAFGRGGRKHSSAHYDAGSRTLALAKNAGGGALAHEWMHAFDHYIASKLFSQAASHEFASQLWLKDRQIRPHPLNSKLDDCYRSIFLNKSQNDANEYVARSMLADQHLQQLYYAQPQELVARAFEAMVQDHKIKNAFLVQGTKQSTEAKLGIYPQGQLRQTISQKLLDYFRHLGQAIGK